MPWTDLGVLPGVFVCSAKLLAFSGEMLEYPRKFLGCCRKVLGWHGAFLELLGFPYSILWWCVLGREWGAPRLFLGVPRR